MNLFSFPPPEWLVGWGVNVAWGAVIIGVVFVIFVTLIKRYDN